MTTEPITPERLAKIREELKRAAIVRFGDVVDLLAEVDRLRAESDSWQRATDRWQAAYERVCGEAQDHLARAEIAETALADRDAKIANALKLAHLCDCDCWSDELEDRRS